MRTEDKEPLCLAHDAEQTTLHTPEHRIVRGRKSPADPHVSGLQQHKPTNTASRRTTDKTTPHQGQPRRRRGSLATPRVDLTIDGQRIYMTDQVRRWIEVLFPHAVSVHQSLPSLISEAIALGSVQYGMKEALDWAKGFKFPYGLGDRDAAVLRSHDYDLTAMITEWQQRMPHSRLSKQSVTTWVPADDIDFKLIMELTDGVPFPVAPDFVPNGKPYGLRAKYVQMSSVVNKLLHDLYKKRLCVIVPTSEAVKIKMQFRGTLGLIRYLQYSSIHWTTKANQPKGRPLGDSSAAESGQPLNSDAVKAMVDDHFGKITHPTVHSLASMILSHVDDCDGEWDDLVLFKMDLRGAFSLLNIRPDDAGLSAFELTDDLTLIHIAGWFGWTGMPGSFQVITRVLCRIIQSNPEFKGKCGMYVDDLMGVCRRRFLTACLAVARRSAEGLLGTDSVEDTKTEYGRALDWIGWRLNLDTRTITVAKRNMLKTFYGFFSIDTSASVNLRTLQTLASWGSRYSLVCRFMRPHTHVLYRSLRPYQDRNHVHLPLSKEVVICINMWRACLALMDFQEQGFSRTLDSFREPRHRFVVSYDASLTGIGIIVNKIVEEKETPWKASRVSIPYDLQDDSSWQNTVEFIAVVVAFAGLARLGVASEDIIIRGDNISSLQWAVSESFKSERARNASVLYTFIGLAYDLKTSEGRHIAGKKHLVCDSLSRGFTSIKSHGFDESDELWPTDDPDLHEIMRIMDPTHSALDTETSAAVFMSSCARITRSWQRTSYGPKPLGVLELRDEGCPVLRAWNAQSATRNDMAAEAFLNKTLESIGAVQNPLPPDTAVQGRNTPPCL